MGNRRLDVMRHAIAKRKLGGAAPSFVRNLLAPSCGTLAQRHIQRMETVGDFILVWFKGWSEPLHFPRAVDLHALHQTVAEQFYAWNWHHYEEAETQVAGDVVLDCGAAEGLFSYLVRDRAEQVICFEPLPEFVGALERTFASAPNVTILPVALGDVVGTAYLHKHGNASYLTSEVTPDHVGVTTIDALVTERKIRPTYIKADLEGYEVKLLQGARQTIEEYKPKLAITTYHREGDADQLVRLLRGLRPDYSFRLKGIEEKWGMPVMLHAW